MASPLARAGVPVAAVTSLLLLAATFVMQTMVIPTYQDFYAGAGMSLSLPVRISIGAARFWWLLLPALLVVIALALRANRGEEGAAARAGVFSLTNLLLTVFVLMQCWLVVDFAIRMPGVGHHTAG